MIVFLEIVFDFILGNGENAVIAVEITVEVRLLDGKLQIPAHGLGVGAVFGKLLF